MNSSIKTRDIPITAAKGFPAELNGTIHCYGQNPEGAGREHIFSFVFYYDTKKALKIEETDYFRGLEAYIQMVHDDVHAPYFGMIVYTNTLTAKLFQEFFPLQRYPNLIVAIPEWPLYTTSEGDLDNTVLTTMRYQAVEAFPYANVHMRDADTLFVSLLLKMNQKEFYEVVREWEDKYLRSFLPKVESLGKQIVLGSHEDYTLSNYHGNLIYPVDFTFSLPMNSGYQLFPITPSTELPRPFMIRKPFPYEQYSTGFKRKYMYGYEKESENHGVFAGFSTVLRNRTGIENFWAICVEYMVQRYRMTRDSISNRFHSRSSYAIGKDERMLIYGIIPRLFDTIFFMDINYNGGELPYSLLSKIKTRKDIELYKDKKSVELLSPSYLDKVPLNVDPSDSSTLPGMFYAQVQAYGAWLATMKAAYPTEKAFLNAIDTNLSQALTPDELMKIYEEMGLKNLATNLKGWQGNEDREAFAEYEKAGRKATVRRSGGGGTRRRVRSKTQKKRNTK